MASIHKRSRNGCQSCRLRRRKCDGGRPICENCIKKKLSCAWGLKASFHPSRLLELSTNDQQSLFTIENERRKDDGNRKKIVPSSIIDNTNEIIYTYRKSSKLALDGSQTCEFLSDEDDEDQNNDSSEGGDNEISVSEAISTEHAEPRLSDLGMVDKDPHTESTETTVFSPALAHEYTASSQIEGRMPVESSAQDVEISVDLDHIFDYDFGNSLWDSVMPAEPFTPPFSLGLALSRKATTAPELDFPIDESQTLTLLRSFLTESATWCETTDTSKQFSVVCAHDIIDHKILKASALALACRQLSVTGYPVEDVALQLYQYTIQLLIQQNPDHADAFILAACTLLCVYEMMASDVLDWRRHLKGCAGLFSSKKWNGSSTGLIKTCFWAFARIDIWAAFILEKRTLIPTSHWVAHESLETGAMLECPDDYCNLSILNFARVVNCLGRDENGSTTPESTIGLQRLWGRFQEWWNMRPKRVRPLYKIDPTDSNPFPALMFAYPAAICGNVFYHAGCLLLLNRLGIKVDAPKNEQTIDAVWHANELCGISVSNVDHANWVNHLQPLYIAGQAFGPPQQNGIRPQQSLRHRSGDEGKRALKRSPFDTGPSERLNEAGGIRATGSSQFAAEKIAILKHLILIQRETGWKTESRAEDLRILWGLQ